jgi:hypothetical protein
MNTVTIPAETEHILLYLLITNLRSARTLDALRTLPMGSTRIETILARLIEAGYVCTDESTFELTFSGLHLARQIQTHAMSERLGLANEAQLDQHLEMNAAIPAIGTHPLRAGGEHAHAVDAAQHETLRYVLAFELPRNVLPIPVLNGDVLGRVTDVDISLPYDEFASGEHCRFTIGSENEETILFVEDLGSRNGTYVNGYQLEPGQPFGLDHGDRIHVGSTILIVVKIPG